MKENFLDLSGLSGPILSGLSIYSIIEKTTPVIAWVGLIVGTITTILVGFYYAKRIFSKNG